MKTTIYISDKLHELVKKADINVSEICRKALENEIYGDNPEYYEIKIKEQNKRVIDEQNKKIQLEKLYERAKNQREIHKERILSTKPEPRSYRKIIKKTEGGDS